MNRLSFIHRRLRSEKGFTLVELMMAALIAAIGVGAMTTVLTGSRTLTVDSERGTTQAHVAEREMERAMAVPYDGLALAQSPTTSADSLDPRFHVSFTGGEYEYRWDQSTGSTASPEDVIVDSADGELDASTAWNDGELSGTVYRFVTEVDDPEVNNPTDPDPEAKRITVAVTVNGGARPRKAIVLNSVVAP